MKLFKVQVIGAAPSFFLLNALSVRMRLALRSLAPVAGYLGCFHLPAAANGIDQYDTVWTYFDFCENPLVVDLMGTFPLSSTFNSVMIVHAFGTFTNLVVTIQL